MDVIKMKCLTIRIRKNDTIDGKRMHTVILDMLKKSDISGATVWTGVGGYGKRGKSDVHMEGITVNMPLVIEAVDTPDKIESVISGIKKLVHDNGVLTMHDVDSF